MLMPAKYTHRKSKGHNISGFTVVTKTNDFDSNEHITQNHNHNWGEYVNSIIPVNIQSSSEARVIIQNTN